MRLSPILPCTETSPVLCENQSFFSLFEMWSSLLIVILFFSYFLPYDEVLSDICYHYLVFMDLVSGYSKSDLAVFVSCNFCYPSFLFCSIFSSPVDVQLKQLNPFCWAWPCLIFFRWGTHLYVSLFPSVRPYVCCTPCLRNRTSSNHNVWYTCVKWWYLQEFYSFFWNFDFLGC